MTMKKVLSGVLTLLLMLGAVSAYAESVTWGMSREQVTSLMGEPDDEDSGFSDGDVIIRYYDQHISKYDHAILVYLFMNNQLFLKAYGITDEGAEVLPYLSGALEQKYGPASADTSIVIGIAGFMGAEMDEAELNEKRTSGEVDYRTWTPDEENQIVLMQYKDQEMVGLFYIHPQSLQTETEYNMDGL